MIGTAVANTRPPVASISIVDYSAASVTLISINAVGATTGRGSDTFTHDQANGMISATVAAL